MKKSISCLVSVLLLLVILGTAVSMSGCQKSKESNKVVIFTAMDSKRIEAMQSKLTDKFPDLEISTQYLSTGEMGTKLNAEGVKTEADIILDLESTIMEGMLDNFVDLSDLNINIPEYLPGYNPSHNKYYIWQKYDGAIIIDRKKLDELGLPVPNNYEDLTNSVYKGLIVAADPKLSGTGYMYLNNWINMWGEEKAFTFVDELNKNIYQYTSSGSTIPKLIAQKEAVIGLGVIFNALNTNKELSDDDKLKMIIPESGSPYNLTSAGIIKGKESNKNVVSVFNYIMSEYMQYDKEYFSPGKLLVNQNNKVATYPNVEKTGDMSTLLDIALKERLLDGWKH